MSRAIFDSGRMMIGSSTEVPEGTLWVNCQIWLWQGVTLTVNGTVANCLFHVDDESLRLEGNGEFAYNYIDTLRGDEDASV